MFGEALDQMRACLGLSNLYIGRGPRGLCTIMLLDNGLAGNALHPPQVTACVLASARTEGCGLNDNGPDVCILVEFICDTIGQL